MRRSFGEIMAAALIETAPANKPIAAIHSSQGNKGLFFISISAKPCVIRIASFIITAATKTFMPFFANLLFTSKNLIWIKWARR